MSESVGEVQLDLVTNQKEFNKQMSGINTTAKRVGKTIAAAFAVTKIVSFGRECIYNYAKAGTVSFDEIYASCKALNVSIGPTDFVSSIETTHCYKDGNTVVLSGIFTPAKTGTGIHCFTVNTNYKPKVNVPIVASTYTASCGVEGTINTSGQLLFNFSVVANVRFIAVYKM